jgi:hypothetical protein
MVGLRVRDPLSVNHASVLVGHEGVAVGVTQLRVEVG